LQALNKDPAVMKSPASAVSAGCLQQRKIFFELARGCAMIALFLD
jgi:hypothetical protein